MKAVIRRDKRLVCDEIADLKPAEGQVLVKTLACGICGSDLHALHHMEHMIDLSGAPARRTAVSIRPPTRSSATNSARRSSTMARARPRR